MWMSLQRPLNLSDFVVWLRGLSHWPIWQRDRTVPATVVSSGLPRTRWRKARIPISLGPCLSICGGRTSAHVAEHGIRHRAAERPLEESCSHRRRTDDERCKHKPDAALLQCHGRETFAHGGRALEAAGVSKQKG